MFSSILFPLNKIKAIGPTNCELNTSVLDISNGPHYVITTIKNLTERHSSHFLSLCFIGWVLPNSKIRKNTISTQFFQKIKEEKTLPNSLWGRITVIPEQAKTVQNKHFRSIYLYDFRSKDPQQIK